MAGMQDRYGTFEAPHDSDPTRPDENAATSSAASSLPGHRSGGREKPDQQPMPSNHDRESIRSASAVSHGSAQAGVRSLEAIATTWTRTGLYIAYLGIALTAWTTSLESQTTTNLTIYATSAFSAHSLVATVLVVQGVVLSVVKPPMSKIADVFGRFEAFSLSVILYIIGYILQAASKNVETYAAAQLFYSAGQTGLQILIQIFIADTSDLLNRALIVTLPDVPFLLTVWIGPPLAGRILKDLNWRWGYGIWAVILPVSFLPLALALCINQRKAAKKGLIPPSPFIGLNAWQIAKRLWFELDFFGLVLICAGFSLVLIPLTLGADATWKDPSILSMLTVGVVCLVAFPFWERSKTLAPRAFFPRALFKNKTVLAGLAFAFFYFMAFYLSVFPYFQSYLLVVYDLSVTQAGHIVQIFTFAATVTSILVSLAIKYTRRYRTFVTVGAGVYLGGLILMVFARSEGSTLTAVMGAQMLIGIGGGMCHGPAQLGVQASASHQEVAAATAAFLTLLEIGGAVGSAISGAIWTSNIPFKLNEYLPEETRDQANAIYGNIGLAANGWPVGSPTRTAINQAYQETMTKILIAAVVAASPCIFLSLLMKKYKLDEIDQQVKGVVIGGTDSTDYSEAGPSNDPTRRLLHDDDYDDENDDDDNDEERFGGDTGSESIKLRRSRSTLRPVSSGT